MTKIIDIHGHYVFGVDDGAETLPMALEMIHSACAQDVTDIVCTSHDSAFIPACRKNMALLQECLDESGTPVTLHPDRVWLRADSRPPGAVYLAAS